MRDRKTIPVPQSAFLGGKAKPVVEEGKEEEDQEEEEEDEIAMDDMLELGEEEVGGSRNSGLEFLVDMDVKNLTRYVASGALFFPTTNPLHTGRRKRPTGSTPYKLSLIHI